MQYLLMISGDEVRLYFIMAICAHALDHASRIRAAVDEISQHDEHVPSRRPPRDIRFDLRQQPIQQVQPPMDVADRIGSIPLRGSRRFSFLAAPAKHLSVLTPSFGLKLPNRLQISFNYQPFVEAAFDHFSTGHAHRDPLTIVHLPDGLHGLRKGFMIANLA